ncbi:MAG TPA: MBL fold metallo-hydrolase [Pyrinomonadaceae bacterium]|nr:MBL fold metallo-hydrolase [Pyrinomonadaceae bacterium]
MYFKQFYLGCLAHASYLIGSDGEAAVVDPQRDVDQYLKEAEAQGFAIKFVIETHLHADFVSGHRELAERTGAEIVFGAKAAATFPPRAVTDGEEIPVGRVILRVLETPGHTPESISILVVDPDSSLEPTKVLTGDTLFIGDVGRPDLAGAKGYTSQQMAELLYDSLQHKLLKLPDTVEVYPAHGAGSMCGRNISKETSSTIGEQRKFNYALKPMSKDEFVRLMTTDLPEAPKYFSRDAEINRTGAPALDEVPRPVALSAQEVHTLVNEGHTVLDVRSAAPFGTGHVPGAINIGLGGQFAMWAGSLLPLNEPLVLVADSEEQVDEATMRLARVGLETVKGYLRGGMLVWHEAGYASAKVSQISVDELKEILREDSELQVVDVRRPPEYNGGHVPKATSAPLSILKERLPASGLDCTKPTAVICAGGYRSSAATSILAQAGFTDLRNVTGGTSAWINAGYAVDKLTVGAAASE